MIWNYKKLKISVKYGSLFYAFYSADTNNDFPPQGTFDLTSTDMCLL